MGTNSTNDLWNVLIIDDEPDFCELVFDFLEISELFNSVVVSNSIAEAKQKLANQEFELLIIDNNMPRRTGLEFIHFLKYQSLKTPPEIILVSGALTKDDMLKAIMMNVKNILIKPFSNDQLIKMVTKILMRAKLKDK